MHAFTCSATGYDRYLQRGEAALVDKSPKPSKVWNRIPDNIRDKVVKLAVDEPELSSRELAVMFTDTERYFISEASVYRILKAHDMITSPAYIVVKAANESSDINQLSFSAALRLPVRQWANRLHLFKGYWLELVLPVHYPGRL